MLANIKYIVKLLSYIIKYDTGLAPNPFWNYCTLAVCTPNHKNAQLEKDDWILGLSPKSTGNKIVYLMNLTEEKMFFNDFFNDKRFNRKKPNVRGNIKQKVGDNLYYLNSFNNWEQIKTLYHKTDEERKEDLKHPYVFISRYFFYFGNKRFPLDKKFKDFIIGRGIKYCKDENKINTFTDFINNHFTPGIIGLPLDMVTKYKLIKC